ncbi:MAG: hypothetical protein WD403_15955 [Pirellulales bacterium]
MRATTAGHTARLPRWALACLAAGVLPCLCCAWQAAALQPPQAGAGQSVAAAPPAKGQPPKSPARQANKAGRHTASSPGIDRARLAARGIRVVEGEHLTLFTDLAPADEIDRLPADFDHAYPQWKAWFNRDAKNRPWRVSCYWIEQAERFQAAGLLPGDLPPFKHGYSRGNEIWCYDQPSDYYRRHLMLHEATHAFMEAALGGCGPPWYMEGMAELLATHTLVDGRPLLAQFPPTRDEVAGWGRIKLVRDAVGQGRPLGLGDVLDYGPRAHLENEPYGWCWAAAALLSGHPRYRDRFGRLPALVRQKDFNRRFRQLYDDDWNELTEEWQVFTGSLEYGHDLARWAIEFAPGEPLAAGGRRVSVAADRGWQSSGVRLEAGATYRLEASGRFQVAAGPPAWISEAGGVSIRYHRGRPLGMLLAAVRSQPSAGGKAAQRQPSGLLSPLAAGLSSTLAPVESGTLYLCVNDSPAELADNSGSLEVLITRE